MQRAANLILVGPMGSGKSALGRLVAARLGLEFADTDRRIEKRTGVSIATIFEHEGEAGFRARERQVVAELCAGRDRVIATGGGVVLDAANRACLRASGVVVHLHVDVETQLARLARDRSRPLLEDPDRRGVLERLAAERAPLYAEVADLQIDVAACSVERACERLFHLLPPGWLPASTSTSA
ncbi:shikimate kinase [Coralloluteibacterium thermophilus]|uniref:Shikimate kinase n=1 Tax=Coralloluteibacterium thermophilum TaxID=2707049 RepID=A0ABV9NI86_9GAMM